MHTRAHTHTSGRTINTQIPDTTINVHVELTFSWLAENGGFAGGTTALVCIMCTKNGVRERGGGEGEREREREGGREGEREMENEID